MAIDVYLGLTEGELRKGSPLPRNTAWMACHFSPNSTGISNAPRWLPEGNLLILDDSAPIRGHDPGRILEELAALVESFGCAALLLDFQRSGSEDMVGALSDGLPCPVAVSSLYGALTRGPVLLPPVPVFRILREHIRPWKGRELWLELSPEGCEVQLDEKGARMEPWWPEGGFPFRHDALKCHYRTELRPDTAVFRGHRSSQDLKELLDEAEGLGITAALGLWQEFPEFA